MSSPIALALHGGAGRRAARGYDRERIVLGELARLLWADLERGRSALDAAAHAVQALEACGLFMAGRGARPNSRGLYELDAALMEGDSRRAGAVAALRGFESPIRVAREVMDHTRHVLLAGDGAAAFARSRSLPEIGDEAEWYAHASTHADEQPDHGTVGCVVLDRRGRLAAATSTAGVTDKLWGRVGDSPLIGAGTWADHEVAVSCTGQGEAFIRCAAAAQLVLRVRLAGEDLGAAADAVLGEVKALGGEGGLIAVNRHGRIAAPFNAPMMAYATVSADGAVKVAC